MLIGCIKCHVAVLEPHPELVFWFKCPLCGYCEFNVEWLAPSIRETASQNKFAKRSHLMIQDLWKDKIIYRD